jgi:AcrR family transcriptional regulator
MTDSKRAALVEAAAAHALRVGAGALRLRDLAAALGTSDRMLLYYFKTKENLVEAVLLHIAGMMQAEAVRRSPPGRVRPPQLLDLVWEVLGDPAMAPVAAFWLEIVALATRGEAPYARIVPLIQEGFLAWAVERLDAPAKKRPALALALLAQVDGLILLRGVGDAKLPEAALKEARAVWSKA